MLNYIFFFGQIILVKRVRFILYFKNIYVFGRLKYLLKINCLRENTQFVIDILVLWIKTGNNDLWHCIGTLFVRSSLHDKYRKITAWSVRKRYTHPRKSRLNKVLRYRFIHGNWNDVIGETQGTTALHKISKVVE